MKKVGDLYTVRGQIATGTYNNKIQLFDGRFDTGFKLVELTIEGSTPQDGHEVLFTVTTEEAGSLISSWDWGENTEIAWANLDMPTSSRDAYRSVVDPDNLIVQDLYLSAYTTGEGTSVNYMMRLQKFDISDWQGALAMVRNRSQG